MLVRRLTTILPAMTLAEAIETTPIHSVAGRAGDRTALVTTRPFRAPHQTISRTLLTCSTGRADAWLGSPVSLTHQ
jgi:magnesium chelatase family protein